MLIQHFVTGPLGVNCYLVIDENTKTGFIVDPGGESGKLVQSVRDKGVNITHLILTHGHPDHLCGLDFFLRTFPEILVVAHEAEDDMLQDSKKNQSAMYCGKPVSVQPDITVNDMDTLKIGEMELLFIHTPGHTKGGMCIYLEGTLFSGDTLFQNSIGRTDFPYSSYPAIRSAIKDKLFTLPAETVVYPGHEGFTTIGHEKEHNPFV